MDLSNDYINVKTISTIQKILELLKEMTLIIKRTDSNIINTKWYFFSFES